MAFPQHHLFRRPASRTTEPSINTNTTGINETSSVTEGPAATTNSTESNVEENILIVPIPNNNSIPQHHTLPTTISPAFTQQNTQLRRRLILNEIERVQRANFIHFTLLCLVPTSLLLIVIAAILSDDGDCGGDDTMDGILRCEREERSFVNAFTTRCVCEGVMGVENPQEEDGDGDGLF